jgi:hypothetical protein
LESHNLRLSSYDIENMPGNMYARTHYPSIGKPCPDFKNNTWRRTAGEKNTGRMSRIEPMLDPRQKADCHERGEARRHDCMTKSGCRKLQPRPTAENNNG